MAGKFIAKVNVLFGADIKQFSTKMQNVARSVKNAGKDMEKIGSQMSRFSAAIAASAGVAVYAWDKQAMAIAQVESGLKSTNGIVGKTSEELQNTASELQNITRFGDEDILRNVTAQLLTFTNIANEQFEQTQVAALNLATRLNGDLKGASIQLGKALNDPIANLSALSRSGIQFSNEQKSLIKSLWETGQQAKAQTLILEELEKQYGGSAEAAAKAGAGSLIQLKNSIGDLSEQFGKIILDYITPFINKLKGIVEGFQNLDESTKRMIVVMTGIVAAIGPVLLVLGKIIALAPAVASAWTVMTGPIGLAIAAIAAIGSAAIYVYDNWDAFKERFNLLWVNIKNGVIEKIAQIIEGFGGLVESLTGTNPFKSLSDKLRDLKSEVVESNTEFKSFGDSMKDTFNDVKEYLFGVEKQAEKTTKAVNNVV